MCVSGAAAGGAACSPLTVTGYVGEYAGTAAPGEQLQSLAPAIQAVQPTCAVCSRL